MYSRQHGDKCKCVEKVYSMLCSIYTRYTPLQYTHNIQYILTSLTSFNPKLVIVLTSLIIFILFFASNDINLISNASFTFTGSGATVSLSAAADVADDFFGPPPADTLPKLCTLISSSEIPNRVYI